MDLFFFILLLLGQNSDFTCSVSRMKLFWKIKSDWKCLKKHLFVNLCCIHNLSMLKGLVVQFRHRVQRGWCDAGYISPFFNQKQEYFWLKWMGDRKEHFLKGVSCRHGTSWTVINWSQCQSGAQKPSLSADTLHNFGFSILRSRSWILIIRNALNLYIF